TERHTYETLSRRMEIIAAHLRSTHGFETGARLLLAYPPGLEMICAFFGCVRAGLIPVPVYPPTAHGFQAAVYKMAHIARDCGASAILTTRQYDSSLENRLRKHSDGAQHNHAEEFSYISQLKRIVTEEMQGDVVAQAAESSSVLFLQYTSGSTSHPK